MSLWGKSTSAESRPKWLPEDSNADKITHLEKIVSHNQADGH